MRQIVTLSLLGATFTATAGPEGGQVVGGTGSIAQSGALTQINQASQALAINWNNFNVGAAETVRFVQPNASSVALNRITGGNASAIFGTIDANGTVFLVNPSGVLFAESAQINVASLMASGLDMSVDDFMAGRYNLAAAGTPGYVINHGTIAAATGGSVALVGGQVVNTGLIRANYGRVTLAGAEAGYIDFEGDGLMRFEVTGELKQKLDGADAAVTNAGVIEATGGQVVLEARAARGVFDTLVNNEGIIQAGAISTEGGVVRLVADGGDAVNSGTIDVSSVNGPAGTVTMSAVDGKVVNTGTIHAVSQQATGGQVLLAATDGNVESSGEILATSVEGAGGFVELVSNADTIINSGTVDAGSVEATGGTIHVLGERVAVVGPSRLGSAGGAGGGTILIGGDFQGRNPLIRNASRTFVGPDAVINADAVNSGTGGRVIIWSDDYTWFYGTVSARGPPRGLGGFTEVSSHGTLEYRGLVDLRAPLGITGTLLLDPTDVRICTSPGGGCTSSSDLTPTGSNPVTFSDTNDNGPSPSVMRTQDLVAQLGVTNVIITTASGFGDVGNITVDDTFTWTGGNSLTLVATNHITVNAGITASGSGSLTLMGGSSGTVAVNAGISLNGGTFTASGGTITTGASGTIAVGTGSISLTGEEIDLGAALSGTGTLTLQPLNATTTIGVAGGGGTLDLSTTDLGFVTNGFGSILIGRSDTSVGITINTVTFTDPVTFRAPSGGSISVAQALAGSGDATVTFTGTTLLSAGVTTADQNITVTGNLSVAEAGSVTLSTGVTGAGNISISGTTDGTAGGGAESLTVAAGTGTVGFTGAVGATTPLNLTLQSNDATATGTVTFTAAANVLGLTTFGRGYAVVFNGGGTFTNAVTFLNTAGVTLGNDAGDSFTFNGGLTSTVSSNSFAGTIATSNDAISIGSATLTAATTLNSGTASLTLGGAVATFALTLTGDEIELSGAADSIDGTAAITLQSATVAQTIDIGGAGGTGALDLTAAEIATIKDGHSSITIGRSDGTGGMTIAAITFNDPVTLRSPAGGTLAVNGQITGAGNASVTLDGSGATTVLSADIVTADQDITISDSVVVADTLTVVLSTGTGGGGNISIAGTTNGDATTGAAETLQLISGSGTIGLTGVVGGTTPLNLTLQSDVAGNTGAVTFTGAVNALGITTFARGYAVSLLDGGTVTAAVSFLNTAGVTLGNANTDVTTFNGGVTSTASTTTIAGTVATSNDGISLGAVVLATDSTLTSGSGAISTGTVTDGASQFDLTLQDNTGASTGGVTFTGNVTIDDLVTFGQAYAVSLQGAANTFDSQVTFLNTGATTLGNDNTDSSTFDAGVTATAGAVNLAGTVATTGDTLSLGAVTLTAASTLKSGAGSISVASATGAFALTLQDNTGASTGGVTFTGNVTIDDLITFGQNYAVSLQGAANTFTSQVTFLNTGATNLGNDNTDSTTFGGGLTASAGAVNIAGTVASSDDLITLGAFTLTANATVDSNATTTAGDLNLGVVTGAGFDLTLETGGVANADVSGSSTSGVGTLTLQNVGGTATFSGIVGAATLTVAGTVVNVSLTGGASITNAVTFNNTGTLTLGDAAADTFTFTGGVVATAPSGISLFGSVVTTNTALTLGDSGTATTLTGNSSLTAGTGTVSLDDTNVSTFSLTITGDGIDLTGGANSITGSGAVVLQGGAPATTVGVAGGAGTLDLSTTDLDALADGHSAITIGRTDGDGLVTVNAYTFKDPVTLRAGGATSGDITVAGALATSGNTGITLTTGRNLTISSTITTGADAAGNARNSGAITITAGGNVSLGGAVSTGAVSINDVAASNQATTGNISLTVTGTLTGAGSLATGAASVDGTMPDTPQSGSISLNVGGAIQLSGADALKTGNASVTAANGNDIPTVGSIAITSADKVSSDGGTGKLDVSLGTATGDTPVLPTLSVSTDGGAGDAGGIFVTSGEALRLGALTTAGTAQNVSISTANQALTLTNAAESLSGDAITLDAGTGTLTFSDTSFAVGAGSLTLQANDMVLTTTANAISGTGTVVLSPGAAGTTVGIAGGAGTLALSAAEIGAFANGFSLITIGRNDSSAALTIGGAVTFNDNVSLIAGSITSSATLTGSSATVRMEAVAGSIIDGDDSNASNVTANSITLVASASVGEGTGDPFDIADNTILAIDVRGNFHVRGDNDAAFRLASLSLTLDPATGADTYDLTNVNNFNLTNDLTDNGGGLTIAGITYSVGSVVVPMNITIIVRQGDVTLGDAGVSAAAINFGNEGGNIVITAQDGSILDASTAGADDQSTGFANLITLSANTATLTAINGPNATTATVGGSGANEDIDIIGGGICSGTDGSFCTSTVNANSHSANINVATDGDLSVHDLVSGNFTFNVELCAFSASDVCILVAENGTDFNPATTGDGGAFTLTVNVAAGANLYIYDNGTSVDVDPDVGVTMGAGGIYDISSGSISITVAGGSIFEVNNTTSPEIVSGATVTLNATAGIGTAVSPLDVTLAALVAHVTAAGNLVVNETDAITLTDLDTANGLILITAGGAITATDVVSTTDNDANDITLSGTGVVLVAVNAGTTAGDVFVNGGSGTITTTGSQVTGHVVTLTSTGAIGTAGTPISLDTANIVISAGAAFNVNATTGATNNDLASITITTAGNTIGATSDVIANNLTFDVTGNGTDITITNATDTSGVDLSFTTTSGDLIVNTIGAGSGAVTLVANTAGTQDILDDEAGLASTTRITGGAVTLTAGGTIGTAGTDVDTSATTLALTSGGLMNVDENDGVNVLSAVANNGAITIGAGGLLTATSIVSTTDNDANDISLTGVGIALGVVTAGAAGDVTLAAGAGAITDTNGATPNVTADVLTASAATGIDLDSTIASLVAHVTGAGDLLLDETNALTLSDVDTANGAITVTAGGALTATDVASTTDADANDISLTGDGITVGAITAGAAGDVTLAAGASAVTDANADGNAGAVNITADDLAVTAGSIGTGANALETAASNFEATSAGGVFITNTGALTIGGASGGLTGISAGGGADVVVTSSGALTVSEAVTSTTGGSITLTATGNPLTLSAQVRTSGGNGSIALAGSGLAVSDSTLSPDIGVAGTGTITTSIAGSTTLGADVQVVTAGGTLTLNTDELVIDTSGTPASLDAGTGLVVIRPQTGAGAIAVDLGSNTATASTLELDDAELGRITAGALQIGDANTGSISITAPLDFTDASAIPALTLTTGGDLLNPAGGSVTVANLTVTANNVGTGAEPLMTSVGTLTTDTSGAGGNQFIVEADGLTDADLDAGSGSIALVLTLGTFTDVAGADVDFTASSLVVTLNDATTQDFGTGANPVETAVDSIEVDRSVGTGDVNIAEADDIQVVDITTFDGSVSVAAGDMLTVDVITVGDDDASGDEFVTLTTTNGGDVWLDTIDGIIDLITINSDGAIEDNIGGTTLVARELDFSAQTGIGAAGTLNTSANYISADSASGDIDLYNDSAGDAANPDAPPIDQNNDSIPDPLPVVEINSITTDSGNITFYQDGGASLVVDVATTTTSGDIDITRDDAGTGTGGLVLLSVDSAGSLTASTTGTDGGMLIDDLSAVTSIVLSSLGDINENFFIAGGSADPDVDITTPILTLIAPEGIGNMMVPEPVEISVDDLSVDSTGNNGSIYLTESNGLTDLNLNAGSGDINLTLTLGGIADTSWDPLESTCRHASLSIL